MSKQSLLDVVEDIPPENREDVKSAIKMWLGDVELTKELEEDLRYQAALFGAVNLMRHPGFDWIHKDEKVSEIADRWNTAFRSTDELGYGVRFSTSKSKMATFGVVFRHPNSNKRVQRYFRVSFLPDGTFLSDGKSYKMDELLRALVVMANRYMEKNGGKSFYPEDLIPLDLNKFKDVKSRLYGYLRSHGAELDGYTENFSTRQRTNYDSPEPMQGGGLGQYDNLLREQYSNLQSKKCAEKSVEDCSHPCEVIETVGRGFLGRRKTVPMCAYSQPIEIARAPDNLPPVTPLTGMVIAAANLELQALLQPILELPGAINVFVRETECCLDDLRKFVGQNSRQNLYLEIMKNSFQNFSFLIPKPPELKPKEVNNWDKLTETVQSVFTYITAVLEQYRDTMNEFINQMESNNLPRYMISDEYTRSVTCNPKDPACCDTQISPNSCMQMMTIKIRRLMMPLEAFRDILRKSDAEKPAGFQEYVDNQVQQTQGLMKQINQLFHFLDNRANASQAELAQHKNDFVRNYGKLVIEPPRRRLFQRGGDEK